MDPYENALIAFLVLQIVFVTTKLSIRTFMVREIAWEDVICFMTLLFSCAYSAAAIASYVVSDLKPLQIVGEISLDRLHAVINLVYSVEVMYIFGTMMLKVNLGLFMLKVMPQAKVKIAIYVLMAISVCFGIAYFFFVFFECPRYWPAHYQAGQCKNPGSVVGMAYGHGVLVAVTDLCFAALTLFTPIYPTEMSRRNQFFFAGILFLACMGCIATFIRIAYIPDLVAPIGNFVYTSRRICLLSSIELSVGLVCLSLASLRPLLDLFRCNLGRNCCSPAEEFKMHSSCTADSPQSDRGCLENEERDVGNPRRIIMDAWIAC